MSDIARSSAAPAALSPRVPALGAVNWIGLQTLFMKEVRRFLKVWIQTIAAPVVTSLLFYTVFTLALRGNANVPPGVNYAHFLASGLIIMTMAQNAFANTSSSVTISKVQGNIVDVLMPPLSAGEVLAAWALGGVARALIVGLTTGLVIALVTGLPLRDPALLLFHGVAGSLMLSLLGILGGIWADKFDHIAAFTNFIIVPLTFLSGTFFSIQGAGDVWYLIAHLNPFFYMIDGFRAGLIGSSDLVMGSHAASIGLGIAVMVAINAALTWVIWRMLVSGFRLKS